MERLDRFMARANAAYYAAHDPFADFTTAPEISQAFGEVLGAWAAVVWQSMGRPHPVILAEAGPGRGTLMADALRAVGRVMPEFRAAVRVHLVETSPRLRAVQAKAVPDAAWHDSLDELPDGPVILLANEFLDSLPIRQLVRRDARWMERFVDGGRFVEHPADLDDAAFAGWRERIGVDGIHELRDPTLAATLGRRLATQGGAALFLDYGPAASGPGDSLQALRDGQPADPLADAGSADLTAHVDFEAFGCYSKLSVHGPIPQGVFLTRLGLFQRIDRLARTRPWREASAMIEAGRRLAEPDRMGALFKALALTQPGLPTPPGFEA